MNFSSTFLHYFRSTSDVSDHNSSDCSKDKICSYRRSSFISKVLAVQGRVLEQEEMNHLSTDRYIDAVTTSLVDVPWVCIGTLLNPLQLYLLFTISATLDSKSSMRTEIVAFLVIPSAEISPLSKSFVV